MSVSGLLLRRDGALEDSRLAVCLVVRLVYSGSRVIHRRFKPSKTLVAPKETMIHGRVSRQDW